MENITRMKFDPAKYKVYTWKHPMMFLWILFPPFFVDDIIMGQRMPKIFLTDKTAPTPKLPGTKPRLVPCPHCGKIHDKRTWSIQNGTAYKNWFGLYCTNCGNAIPCSLNLTSFIILTITYPFWIGFKKPMKQKWLRAQPKRFENLDVESMPILTGGKEWLLSGIGWGLYLFVVFTLVPPYYNNKAFTWKHILFGLLYFVIALVITSFIVKLFQDRKMRKINACVNIPK